MLIILACGAQLQTHEFLARNQADAASAVRTLLQRAIGTKPSEACSELCFFPRAPGFSPISTVCCRS